MDAARIQSLKPLLASFLKRFDGCFVSAGTRGHLSSYVHGQLSDLPRKNSEPIADACDLPRRTLQEFLSLLKWDHALLKTTLQQLAVTAPFFANWPRSFPKSSGCKSSTKRSFPNASTTSSQAS